MTKIVCHVVYGLNVGGLERVLVNTVSRMPSTYQHIVVCLTSYSSSFASLLPSNTQVLSLSKKSGQDFGLYVKWWRLLKQFKPDVVHSYNLATLELQVVSALCGVKVRIHAEHGRDIYDPSGDNKKYQWLRRCVSPFIHTWVAVSTDLHDWLQSTVGLSKRKTKLIRNGVDTEVFVPKKIPRDKFVVGHVGRLSPIKNQKLLVEAFSIAFNSNSQFAENAVLLIVGEGESRKELEQYIDSKKLGAKISLVGLRQNMPSTYRGFSVFVMSSIGEGIPMTLLEAMSSGLPAIVTNVGGMPEVVSRDEGIITPTRDATAMAEALLILFNSPEKREQLALAARKRIQTDFDEAKMVSDYLSLYNQ